MRSDAKIHKCCSLKWFRQKRDSKLRVYVCEACCEMGSFEETVCVISCCYTVRPLLAFTVTLSKCHLSDKTEKHSWIIMHSYRINKWNISLSNFFAWCFPHMLYVFSSLQSSTVRLESVWESFKSVIESWHSYNRASCYMCCYTLQTYTFRYLSLI